MPKEQSPGKPTTRRYSPEEKVSVFCADSGCANSMSPPVHSSSEIFESAGQGGRRKPRRVSILGGEPISQAVADNAICI